jgi:hypothetical protein
MRRSIARALCLVVFLVCYVSEVHGDKRSVDPSIYKRIIGDWQGSLWTKRDCGSSDFISCSYHLIFNEDYSFFTQIGSGCFTRTNTGCKNMGTVTGVTENSITIQYPCPGGCFCDGINASSVEFCYRYERPTAKHLYVAVNREPPALFNECPLSTQVMCVDEGNFTVNVARGVTECSDGPCITCNNARSCSNRGICNDNGGCDCFNSFSGPSCNISACTNSCSGHGICDMTKTKFLMGMSFFDKSKPVGVCRCFSGWSGPTCSAQDIFSGRQKLWQGLIFVGVVSTVTAGAILLRKFIYPPYRSRRSRARHRRLFMPSRRYERRAPIVS